MAHLASRLAALISVAYAICGAANADDISGRWKFRTDNLPSNGCIISGDIAFTRATKANTYSCRFRSREDCTATNGTKSFQEVQQSCTAAAEGSDIVITGKVEKMLDAGPPERREALMQPERYKADNFSVRPKGKDEMIGSFYSLQRSGVRFWRDLDRIS